MSFTKIARLARIAPEFPEFEAEFKGMIESLISPKFKDREFVASLKKTYEQNGKLNAVKEWKAFYNCSLMDGKRAVEELAEKHGWIKPEGW